MYSRDKVTKTEERRGDKRKCSIETYRESGFIRVETTRERGSRKSCVMIRPKRIDEQRRNGDQRERERERNELETRRRSG